MKNFKAIFAIWLLVLVGATVGVMFLLGPAEKDWLFYTNMAILVVVECLFVGALSFTSAKKGYNVQGIALANQIVRYSALMFAIVLIYMLIGYKFVPYIWYFVALIVVTVCYLAVILVVGMGGKVQQDTQADLEARSEAKTDVVNLVKLARAELDNSLSNSGLNGTALLPARDALRNITDNITMIPVNTFSRKPMLTGEVAKWCDTAENFASKLDKAGDDAEKNAVLDELIGAAKKAEARIVALK